MDSARQQSFGIKYYVWEGGDCPLCAPYNGHIFEWGEGDEPGDVHPNCNCTAEPLLDEAAVNDPPVTPVYPIENLIVLLAGGGLARKLGLEAIERAGNSGKPTPSKPTEAPKPPAKPKPDISKRPEGVPKDWKATPTKNGNGKIYQHPTEKGTYVKVEKGNPNASQPGQRYDNVRVQKNGESYDKNGGVVPRRSEESHIPLEDFNPENFNL